MTFVTLERRPRLVQQLESVSAHAIGRRVWQRECFDRIVRSDENLHEKGEYLSARGGAGAPLAAS